MRVCVRVFLICKKQKSLDSSMLIDPYAVFVVKSDDLHSVVIYRQVYRSGLLFSTLQESRKGTFFGFLFQRYSSICVMVYFLNRREARHARAQKEGLEDGHST